MSTPSISRRHLLHGGLGLGALAALGLAGCSNEGRGGSAQADNSSVLLPTYAPFEGVPVDLESQDGASDTMLAYPADPIEVTDGPPGDGEPIGSFALTNSPAAPGLSRNDYWQALNERLGFDYSVSLVPSGDFSERFQTAVAGDQLPDLFTFYPGSVPSLPALLEERATDLTEHLSGDSVLDYPFLANIPTDSWRMSIYGGKIYGIPIPRGPQSSTVMYQRADMLEDLGIDAVPEDAEDFFDLCAELTGSGSGRWALGVVPMNYIRQMFGVPNGWSEDGGSLTSGNEHERQEEALEFGRRLVADRLVHPDAFSSTGPQRKDWNIAGTTPLMEDTFSAWQHITVFPLSEEFRWEVIPPPLADGGGEASIWLGSPTHNLCAVSAKSADRVEALLDFLNYLAAPFGSAEHLFKYYGEEGVHHELDGTDPVLTEKGRSETQLSLVYLAEAPWVNYQPGNPDVARAQFDAQNHTVPTALHNPTLGLYSETSSRRSGQINEALGSAQADILQGREPVTAWADAVETWKSNGGDDIRDEFEEALASSEI